MIKQANPPFSFHHFGRLLFQHRRKAGIYGLFFVIISFNLCLFLRANMHSPAAERIVNVLQLLCFAVMGVANVWLFYKRNFLAELSLSGAKLAFICLLFIVIALVLFVYYYISGNNDLIMAFASSGAFLLPFLIYHGFTTFLDIPAKDYPVWFLPESATAFTTTTVNSMQVQLRLFRTTGDDRANTYPVTVSGKLKLGRLFERFIADRQMHGRKTEIQVSDTQQQRFGWQFYEEKWAGTYRRNLNPSKSLLENKIQPNAKIIIIRIICGK